MMLGVAYYPEQVSPDLWAQDAAWMQSAGVQFARMGEHTWGLLEPEPGKYEFAWLDRAIDGLHSAGIAVLLCTPTACIPTWMYSDDLALVGEDGLRYEHGSRHTYCPNHPVFLDAARQMCRELAAHFVDVPILGWQIDNELGICGSHRCYCERCRALFQDWLSTKYTTFEALNEAWGTVFWSQRYTDWTQIPVPRRTVQGHNPGLALDFAQFTSAHVEAFVREQAAILRRVQPAWTITHNLWTVTDPALDPYGVGGSLDVVGIDAYPTLGGGAVGSAAAYDFARGLQQKPFWGLEMQSRAALSWKDATPTARPGQLRLWAYQAVAHGAERITFFNWRTVPFGAETYWHGILPHSNRPGRFYTELVQIGRELSELPDDFRSSTVQADAALLNDWTSNAAWNSLLTNNPHLSYSDVFNQFYSALYRNQIATDIIGRDADFSRYKILFAPMLYCVDEALVARLRAYVEGGGVLVSTFRSGVATATNRVWPENPLLPLFGIELREYDARAPESPIALTETNGDQDTGSLWCDVVDLRGAQPMALFTSDYYANTPAITRCSIASGQAIYFGTLPTNLSRWIGQLCVQRGLLILPELPEGVEVVSRNGSTGRYSICLNHSDQGVSIMLPHLAAEPIDVPAFGVQFVIQPYLVGET